MSSSARQLRVVHFGAFDLDLSSGELTKYGTRIRLQEQPFQVLSMLLERPGEVVTRDELRQKLWPADTFVDFNHGLNNAVNRLREVLCDSAESPKFIETIPRRGYRMIAPVEQISPVPNSVQTIVGVSAPDTDPAQALLNETAVPAAMPPEWPSRPVSARKESRNRSRVVIVVAMSLILMMALISAGALWIRAPGEIPRIESLAVLPLENVSGDPAQEYFVDGMTDTLITNLAGLSSVRVISRTSSMHYKGTHQPLPEIARALNVDAIVEGTVSRAGTRVRINAQLIDARNDRHLWAEAYERDLHDIMTLQSELSTAIATQVVRRVEPQPRRQLNNRKVNPEAYEAYLRGRYEVNHGAFTDEGWRKAREQFNRAIQLDPGNTEAVVGLAETYIPEDLATARMLAAKALELDERSADAHTILGVAAYGADWNFAESEKELLRALELDPGSVRAHSWYATYLAQMGRCDEALPHFKYAVQLDPLSPYVHADLGMGLYLARRYDESMAALKSALRVDDKLQMAHRHLLRIYEVRSQIPEAINEYAAVPDWFDQTPEEARHVAREFQKAYASGGARAYWLKRLDVQSRKYKSHPWASHPIGLARIYAALGDADQAFAMLQQSYNQHDPMLAAWIASDPQYDDLRSDPRFPALLKQIGLPVPQGGTLPCQSN